jgi:hypothetical protein
MEKQTKMLRPYKWSSWDCEIWEKNNNKIYVFGEQKWADIEVTGNYTLVPLQQHEDFEWVDIASFSMNPKEDEDLLYVIVGDSCTYEASDVNESIDFRGHTELETEYDEQAKKFEKENEYYPNQNEVLDALGYESVTGYHIIKLQQRKIGE